MNEWTQRIASHPALARLKSARESVENTEIRADDIPEVDADLSRIRNVLDALETRFQTIDSALLFPGPLAALENHLQSLISEVAAFQTNRNRGHLTNANNQADSLLSVAAQLGIPIAGSIPIEPKSLESVRDQAEKLVKTLKLSERTVQQQLNKLNESVIATTTEVTAQKGRLDAAIAEYQQQFSAAEGARQQQAAEALKAHAQRLDQAIADAQKRLQDTTQDVSKRLDGTLQDVATRAEDQKRGLEANASEIIAALKEMRGKAENLLHVIGSTGMAGEYQKGSECRPAYGIGMARYCGRSHARADRICNPRICGHSGCNHQLARSVRKSVCGLDIWHPSRVFRAPRGSVFGHRGDKSAIPTGVVIHRPLLGKLAVGYAA